MLLTVRGAGRGAGRWLVVAAVVQVGWAIAMTGTLSAFPMPPWVAFAAEALRPFAWAVFLIAVLWAPSRRPMLAGAIAFAAIIATIQTIAFGVELGPQERFGSGLVAAVLGLLLVEQVWRNAPAGRRWAVKFLCLALAATSAFDIVLYADALLYARFEFGWWAARGWAHAVLVPLIAVSAARTPDWRLDIQVSRAVVFHTATLFASGVFLLAVAAIGYGLRFFGGEWGGVAQTLVVFVALIALVALAASGKVRARLRVSVAKHFFSYRYDYRNEWMRLTDLLSRPDRPGEPGGTLSERALEGLGALVESNAGALWLRGDDGRWTCDARRSMPPQEPLAADDPLPRFLEARQWIVDVDEWRAEPARYGDLHLPHSIVSDPRAWLIVPLSLHDRAIGFVQLQKPVAASTIDWEVRDVLKAAGRQVAGYLAVRQAVEELVQARQFESFNRMSAFVVHDLKNLVAQLSLMLGNAAKHRHNPDFQADMLETVENVVGRMQGLLLQLRAGTRPIEQAAPLPLGEALRTAIASRAGLRIRPELEIDADVASAAVVAHRDRLERVIGHLVQNAIEATPSGGSVRVRARRDGRHAVVEVVDTGRGMSREFVEKQLFRPFTSTKSHGMGIGAFESREYLNEIGGSLLVSSVEDRGTTFTLRLPMQVAAQPITQDL